MKTSTLANLYTASVIAAFLLLTALGNAVAMFVLALAGIGVGAWIFGKRLAGSGIVAAMVACAVALAVALALHHG